MLRHIYENVLTPGQKTRVKQAYYAALKIVTDSIFAYDREKLKHALLDLGIRRGDTLFVHSAFRTFNGLRGTPQDVINSLVDLIGEEGNIIMPALQYRSSSYEHLQKHELFDMRKTCSKMGLITEIFRRKNGVLRSMHPTHSVLAMGKDAAWIVDNHEKCEYPCGKNTPFHKFRSLDGKVLFFDVSFNAFTFIHYIEDLIKNELPFALYRKEPLTATVRDGEGKFRTVRTYVFSDDAVTRRRPCVLKRYLLDRGLIRKEKIGRTILQLVSAEDAVRCTREMLRKHIYFYAGASFHA